MVLLAGFIQFIVAQKLKSEFVLTCDKQKITYVCDKEKDSVSSVTFNLIYDISKSKEIEERARKLKLVDDASGIEGQVTQSDRCKRT